MIDYKELQKDFEDLRNKAIKHHQLIDLRVIFTPEGEIVFDYNMIVNAEENKKYMKRII